MSWTVFLFFIFGFTQQYEATKCVKYSFSKASLVNLCVVAYSSESLDPIPPFTKCH